MLGLSAWGQQRGEYIPADTEVQIFLPVSGIQDYINDLAPIDAPPFILNLLTSIDYEITAYKLRYYTEDTGGNLKTATGLTVLPHNSCRKDMMVYCHGTVYDRAEVPSELSGAAGGLEILFGLLYGGNGFFTVMPDYLGLGDLGYPDSNTDFHLYTNEQTEAMATVDMMVAARKWAEDNGVLLTRKAIISGYSQGGHAGMSTWRYLQQVNNHGFVLTAAGLGSGAYDLSTTQYNFIINNPWGYSRPDFVLYILASYQAAYGDLYTSPSEILVAPFDYLFQTEIITQTATLESLATWVLPYPVMLDPDYYALLQQPANPANKVMNYLRDSDVHDWYNRKPTAMYYCTEDEQVDYRNSQVAEANFDSYFPWWAFWLQALNNSYDIGPYTHGDCVVPYALISKWLQFDFQQTSCSKSARPAPAITAADLISRPVNHFFVELNPATFPEPVVQVDFYLLDGTLAASMDQWEEVDGALRLDTRMLARTAYALRIEGEQGYETYLLTLLDDVKLLEHPQYDPLQYLADERAFRLDLSLLLEPVQEVVIYDNTNWPVRQWLAGEATEELVFSAEGLPAGALTLELRTNERSYFLPLTVPRTAEAATFRIYPNPAADVVTLQLEGDARIHTLTLYNVQGQPVWSRQGIGDHTFRAAFDLPAGLYTVEIITMDGAVLTEPLLIVDQ
jgi:hypothetical protein